jgi:hypothetical protein
MGPQRRLAEITIPPVEPGTEEQDAVNVHPQMARPLPHPSDTESQGSMTGQMYWVGGQPMVWQVTLLPVGSG